MNKKIVFYPLLILLIIYIGGFCALTPLAMKYHGVISEVQYHLYTQPTKRLDESNIIRELYNSNSIYWCEKIESCTVESNNE